MKLFIERSNRSGSVSPNSGLQPATNTKGRDPPVWPLWVNIDCTTVGQLSRASPAQHSHVPWFFFFFKGSNMWSNPSLSPPLTPVRSLRCAYVAPLQARVSHSSCTLRCFGTDSLKLEVRASLGPRICLLLRWHVSFSEFTCSSSPPSYMSSDSLCPPRWKRSAHFLCWQAGCDRLLGVERLELSRALKSNLQNVVIKCSMLPG